MHNSRKTDHVPKWSNTGMIRSMAWTKSAVCGGSCWDVATNDAVKSVRKFPSDIVVPLPQARAWHTLLGARALAARARPQLRLATCPEPTDTQRKHLKDGL